MTWQSHQIKSGVCIEGTVSPSSRSCRERDHLVLHKTCIGREREIIFVHLHRERKRDHICTSLAGLKLVLEKSSGGGGSFGLEVSGGQRKFP